MQYKKHPLSIIPHIITSLILFVLVVPLVFMDVCGEIYHRVCFPLCRMPLISRSRYILIDRHRLEYLNIFEKIACAYCGYANGLIHYLSAIAGSTERYWCGIRHHKKEGFLEPEHHKNFLTYGDKKAFDEFLNK